MDKQTLADKPRCYHPMPIFLAAVLFVAGCSGSGTNSLVRKAGTVSKSETVQLSSGNLSIAPPPGFCKDNKTSQNTTTASTIIFANCGLIDSDGRKTTSPSGFPGVVTTSIAKEPAFLQQEDIAQVDDFLASRDGLASLSATGDPSKIQVVDKRLAPDGIFVQVRDENAPLSKDVWKSYLNRANHLVTVTLHKNSKSELSSEQTMQFLQSYSETITTAQPTADYVEPIEQPVAAPVRTRARSKIDVARQLKRVGLFRRLFL